MKVGTDSVLIGAWARGGNRILDVGTGTGVVAMMMSQRFPDAMVDAVDIDADACAQAEANVAESSFASHVRVWHMPVQQFAEQPAMQGAFQSVVSNPPFFENALRAPERARNMARHTDSLSFADLLKHVKRLLKPTGTFSLVVPDSAREEIDFQAVLNGFYTLHECAVKTTPKKAPKRFLLSYGLVAQPCQHTELIIGSETYQEMLKDFYL